MKIISKYRDYYDYLQGIIGIDEKAVYVRNMEMSDIPHSETAHRFIFHICGKMHFVVLFRGKYYHPNPHIIHEGDTKGELKWEKDHKEYCLKNFPKEVTKAFGLISYNLLGSIFRHHWDSDENDSHGCPVLLEFEEGEFYKNPKLDDFGFASIIKADVLYQNITSWLLSSKDINPETYPTDKEKIISHGMDNKTSFRHPLK